MSLSDEQAKRLYILAGKVRHSMTGLIRSVRWDDAIQSAVLGCVKNADKWDPSLSSFDTYFSMVCRHHMILANKSEQVGLSRLSGPSLNYTHEGSQETAEKYLSHEPDNGVDLRDEYDEILKVIPGLSVHQQGTVADFLGDDSVKSIAHRRKCSVSAINKNRALAFKNIRKAWLGRKPPGSN